MDGAVKLEDIIDLSTSEKNREYFSGHVHDWEVEQMQEQGLGICWKGYRDLWRFMYVVEADGQGIAAAMAASAVAQAPAVASEVFGGIVSERAWEGTG